MENNATILISHDSQDEKIAQEIKNFLEQIFLSEDFYVSGRDLEGGQTWVEQIKHRLKSSKAIIALLTKRSINNHWVYFESGAGFIEDRTIPLLTDNIQSKDLKPPLSLLQARVLSKDGIDNLIKDISSKLGLKRLPQIPGTTSSFINRIEKLLRTGATLELDAIMHPADNFGAIKKWIYDENCLVYDFTVEKIYRVAVDTYFLLDGTEIQLFGRKGATEYVLESMRKAGNFLPLSYENYEIRNGRLIYRRYSPEANTDEVAKDLTELLRSIQQYNSKVAN